MTWHPVATEFDLVPHHIVHGQLLGHELAVWRADDGFVNVWENRCLHRGVRLTIGSTNGSELVCRYHGWRYASRTAGCTYIPAHPADAPARTISNRTFPAVEKYGLVWSGDDPVGDVPEIAALDEGSPFGLRNLPVNASVGLVLAHLAEVTFRPTEALVTDEVPTMDVEHLDDHTVAVAASVGDAATTVVYFVQPVDSARSVIRPVLTEAPAPTEQMAVWRHHAAALAAVVGVAEAAASALPPTPPITPALEQVSVELAGMPAPSGRSAPLRVRVARKWTTATDIAGFELEPLTGSLPAFQPGAHIDVHLPNGLVRQYSLTNGPGETSSYRIGVKLEPQSRGGSQALHETVREGDVLAISEPRNNFPLRRDANDTILIAGGVGVTPMLAMAQALASMQLDFRLHHFARSKQHLAFPQVRSALGDRVVDHVALDPAETATELRTLLAEPGAGRQVYVCGPGPMLDAARSIAAELGWPDTSVHFEYFANPTEIDDSSSFEIALARSAMTLQVPAGRTALGVLRDHGIALPSSCEQGACGTCVATVIEGKVDHQDVHLNATERAANDRMITCVSRALSDRLVLDL